MDSAAKKPIGYRDPFKPGVNPMPGYDSRYSQPYGDIKVDYTVPPVNQAGHPFAYPPQKKSNMGMIFGAILIVLGSLFLIDNLDFIPDFDFDLLWPIALVIAGLAVIFSGKKKPWEHPEAFQQEKRKQILAQLRHKLIPIITNTKTITPQLYKP